jgi:hypothetical protein
VYFFLKNVLARFQIEPLQSGAVMKFDGDEKATHERPIRLVNECIGDLPLVEIEQLLDSLDSRKARESLSIR